jgi:hypothetical protein
MIYIIIFELVSENQPNDEFVASIRSTKVWAKISGTTYLIKTNESATELRDRLKRFLNKNDKLFVSYVAPPAAWLGYSEEVTKWIKENL